MINRIQNKNFCSHNVCLCLLCIIIMYKYTYIENGNIFYVYIYIHRIDMICKYLNISFFYLNIYMHVCVYISIHIDK